MMPCIRSWPSFRPGRPRCLSTAAPCFPESEARLNGVIVFVMLGAALYEFFTRPFVTRDFATKPAPAQAGDTKALRRLGIEEGRLRHGVLHGAPTTFLSKLKGITPLCLCALVAHE